MPAPQAAPPGGTLLAGLDASKGPSTGESCALTDPQKLTTTTSEHSVVESSSQTR